MWLILNQHLWEFNYIHFWKKWNNGFVLEEGRVYVNVWEETVLTNAGHLAFTQRYLS